MIKIINNINNLKESDMNEIVPRVKALLINSNNERRILCLKKS